VLGADASKQDIRVPGQSPSIRNRLSQDFGYLLVSKLLMWWREQHQGDRSGKDDREQEGNIVERLQLHRSAGRQITKLVTNSQPTSP
jgi:hypothetical protein